MKNMEDRSSFIRQPLRQPSVENLQTPEEHTIRCIQESYRFSDNCHSNFVLMNLNELRNSNEFCDVILQVDNVEFPVHRNVLVAASSYFRSMFQSGLSESKQNKVQIKEMEAQTVKPLLEYCYTGVILIKKSNCQNLLAASNFLQILPVKKAACDYLQRHMDTSNCLGISCFAEAHDCVELQIKSFNYALKHFWSVAQNEEFLELTMDKLIELTSSDKLGVENEEQVFLAIKRWQSAKSEERSINFEHVMETVRLPLVDPYFLYDCVQSFPPVFTNPDCMQLVEEAKAYHLLPDRSTETSNIRMKQRDSANMMQVIVAVGGEDDRVVLRSVECYCPMSNMWYTLTSLTFAISKHGVVVSGKNSLYVSGGEFPDGKASCRFWRYDSVIDVWQEMASMLLPRSELGLVALDGYIYAIGGWDGTHRLDSVEKYDPNSNSWSFVKKMKTGMTSPAVVAYDKMLYVAGGAVYEEGDGADYFDRYDPRTDTWTELPRMPIPKSGAGICVLDGCIYLMGGWHASTENTDQVERFCFKTNRWEKVISMLERRYRPGATVIDRKIYVMGGERGWDRYHDSIECFDPEMNQWARVGKLLSQRSWLGCVPLKIKKSVCRET